MDYVWLLDDSQYQVQEISLFDIILIMNKIFFKNKSGLKLCGIWHFPKIKINKAIILAHGFNVDKDEEGIFPQLAERLKEKGFAVFRFDFSTWRKRG